MQRVATGLRELNLSSMRELFSIDVRALAVVRIGCGLLLLVDLLLRAPDIRAFYLSTGLASRPGFFDPIWGWSLHTYLDSEWGILFLFAVHALFACLLLVGAYTRIATVGAFLLTVSLHSANFSILNGGDNILRLMLFFGIFLPWGAVLSYDRLKRQVPSHSSQIFSPWTVVLLLQIVIFYVFAVLHKTGPEWLVDGSAVFYALNSIRYSTDLGNFVGAIPALSPVLTYLVLFIEGLAPLLLFVPLKNAYFRMLGVALLAGLHLSFHMMMNLGWFSIIALFWLSLFLPRQVWDFLERLITRQVSLSVLSAADSTNSSDTREAESRSPIRSYLSVSFAGLYFVCILIWNIENLEVSKRTGTNAFTHNPVFWSLMASAGWMQHWSFFSPNPTIVEMWPVVRITYEDGTFRDAQRDYALVRWELPSDIKEVYKSTRWEAYYTRIFQNVRNLRVNAAGYFCEQARSQGHGAPLRVELYVVRGPDYYDIPKQGPYRGYLLHAQECTSRI